MIARGVRDPRPTFSTPPQPVVKEKCRLDPNYHSCPPGADCPSARKHLARQYVRPVLRQETTAHAIKAAQTDRRQRLVAIWILRIATVVVFVASMWASLLAIHWFAFTWP